MLENELFWMRNKQLKKSTVVYISLNHINNRGVANAKMLGYFDRCFMMHFVLVDDVDSLARKQILLLIAYEHLLEEPRHSLPLHLLKTGESRYDRLLFPLLQWGLLFLLANPLNSEDRLRIWRTTAVHIFIEHLCCRFMVARAILNLFDHLGIVNCFIRI